MHFGLAHFVDPAIVTKLPEIQTECMVPNGKHSSHGHSPHGTWPPGPMHRRPRPLQLLQFEIRLTDSSGLRASVSSTKRWMLDPMLRLLPTVDSNARTTRSVIQFCCCNGRVTRVTTWKAPGRLQGRQAELMPCQPALLITACITPFT